jgi:hypothetical protein
LFGKVGSEWVAWFWSVENVSERHQDVLHFGGRLPLICVDHIQTDQTLFVKVGVVNWRRELELRWLERILTFELEFKVPGVFVVPVLECNVGGISAAGAD